MKRLTGLEEHATMKAKHPDALLLFRVGNFYEAYRDDASTCSEILGITLIRRHSDGESYFTAGFPSHALDTFLPKLVRAGKRVAICDQIEEPKPTVKRGITELMNPAKVAPPQPEPPAAAPKPDKYGQLALF